MFESQEAIFDDDLKELSDADLDSFELRISQYIKQGTTRATRSYKVGITDDPVERWNSAYNGAYDKMILVYYSVNRSLIRKLEALAVNYYKINYDRIAITNKVPGGGGRDSDADKRYLYVVLKYYTSGLS
jgi:uncharacterized ubiquitin-like protein YukD